MFPISREIGIKRRRCPLLFLKGRKKKSGSSKSVPIPFISRERMQTIGQCPLSWHHMGGDTSVYSMGPRRREGAEKEKSARGSLNHREKKGRERWSRFFLRRVSGGYHWEHCKRKKGKSAGTTFSPFYQPKEAHIHCRKVDFITLIKVEKKRKKEFDQIKRKKGKEEPLHQV